MGYFSNGSEGMDYQSRYCFRCANYRDLNDGRGEGCPIFDLHLLWVTDACNGEHAPEDSAHHAKHEALSHFIPIMKDGLGNEQCVMFCEVSEHDRQHSAELVKLEEWNKLYGSNSGATKGAQR